MVQGRDPSQNLILVYKRKGHSSKPDDSDKGDKPMDDITQAIMTNSDCYKAGRTITPKGIMVHSTATPGADAQTIRSAWDRSGAEAAVHYIIDDQRTLQTLPDTCRAWHCGGAANNTHLSFEICEPQECRLIPAEWIALKRGSSGWAVQRLQMELQARGYDPKGVDGSFGPGCDAALRACQKDLGLTADGSCGPATLSKLASRQGSYLAYNPQDTAAYFAAVWGRAVALCVQLCKTYGLRQSDILCHSEGYGGLTTVRPWICSGRRYGDRPRCSRRATGPRSRRASGWPRRPWTTWRRTDTARTCCKSWPRQIRRGVLIMTNKISAGTIARTVVLLLALVNQVLSMLGVQTIPIADEDVNTLIATGWTIAASLAAWWKNNSFTQAALAGDALKDEIRAREE